MRRSSLLHALCAGFRAATLATCTSRQPGGRLSALLSTAPRFGFAWPEALNLVIPRSLQPPGGVYIRELMAYIHVRALGHRAVF